MLSDRKDSYLFPKETNKSGTKVADVLLANVLRYVRYMLSAVHLLSVCVLSVCDVGAPYSGG